MDWSKIKFNDYKGKPLIYPKKVNAETDDTETDNKKPKIFYKCVEWPPMFHYAKYNLTFTKSEIENLNENILFEYLDPINVIGVKKLISSYLVVKTFNLTMGSGQSFAGKHYTDLSIFVECDGKKYTYKYSSYDRYSSYDNSVILSVEGFESYGPNLQAHLSNGHSYRDLFKIIKNQISDRDDLDSIFDVLVVIDLRFKKLMGEKYK